MKISLIILHYGELDTTRRCIESLTRKETERFTLIVVSNTEKIYHAQDFTNKNILVINNKKNLGFAKGVNVGIKRALHENSDYICLLNNDTIVRQSFLEKLVKIFRTREDAGIVGPAILFKKHNKTLYDIGGKINSFFLRTAHTEVEKLALTKVQNPAYISGCCMLIARKVFQRIGTFDEQYFLYYEDADFCLRAKQAGFATYVDTSSVIYHELSKSAGATSPFTVYHLIKSNIYFGKKFAQSPIQLFFHKAFILFQSILFFKANPSTGTAIAKALLQG